MYQHHHWQGALLEMPVSKVVCVGSNYAKHIQEMGSATPTEFAENLAATRLSLTSHELAWIDGITS